MRDHDQRGFALPAVIGALLIMGILVTAGFYTARQEIRIGVADRHTQMAVNIAQAGANEVMANWNGYQLGNILPWQSTTINGTGNGGTWAVTIWNADNFQYFIQSTGTVTEGGDLWAGATRSIGIAAKILFADINPPGALTTQGDVTLQGTAVIDGTNHQSAAWGPYCSGVSGNDTTGVVLNNGTQADGDPNPDLIGTPDLDGSDPYLVDSDVADSTFTQFGDLSFSELVNYAQIDGTDISFQDTWNGPAPSDISGVCDLTDPYNWGDTIPSNPCGGYFPMLYHDGVGTLRLGGGGYGQGILLADGDLIMTGGFTFYGIIIVDGTFDTGAGTNLVVGAVMARNSATLEQTFTGTGEIYYSRCAVTRAVLNNAALARARPLDQRSWVDLTSATN